MYELLVPVDRNESYALAQAEYVTSLPNAVEDVHATVLHVFPQRDYAGAPPQDFEEVGAAVAAAEAIEDAGVSVERHTEGGNVAAHIVDLAEERDVREIVMGGRKRSGVAKVVLGSTSLDVLLSSDRPVAIVE